MSEFREDELVQHPLASLVLPRGWSLVALSELAKELNPGFASGVHNSTGEGVPHLRPMNVDRDGKIDLTVVKSVAATGGIELAAGDVLFNNTNSPDLVGKTAAISAREAGFAYSNHMTCIRPAAGVDTLFLANQLHFLWMSGYFKYRCVNHVNQASISTKTLAGTVPLVIPPVAEQSRIVAKLEELLSDLDAGVAELKAAQAKLGHYRQSLLKAAVDGSLTSEWRKTHTPKESGAQLLERILDERRKRWEAKQLAKFQEQGKTPPKGWQNHYPHPVSPDTTNLPELPEGWTWATVDALSLDQRYGTSAKTNSDDSGVPIIRMGNIQDGELDLADLKYLPEDHEEFPALHLADGDLLFNRTNSSELVGKCAIYRSQIVPCSYASYLIGIRLSPLCLPELVAGYINSAQGRAWVKSVAVQQVGQANVNGTKLAALAMPVPPYEEQVEIVRVMKEQREIASQQLLETRQSLILMSAQRKNILKAAFSGQLVPQDPNDEPASVLLERIRAEREAQGAKEAKRGRKVVYFRI